jgi:hypothetical protein
VELTAEIGPLRFRYAAAGVACLPPIEGQYAMSLDGASVVSATAHGRIYLVLDHRHEPSPDRPALVELWHPSGQTEADLGGLFLICDSQRSSAALHPGDLRSLERLLVASAQQARLDPALSLTGH